MKRHRNRVASERPASRRPRPSPSCVLACSIALGALAGCTPTSFFDTYPSFDSFAGVAALADGGLIVAGHADGSLLPAGAALLRVDADGTPRWALPYPSETALDSFPDEIAPMGDGGVVMAARQVTPVNEVWVIRTDADGSERWSTPLGDPRPGGSLRVGETPDGGIFVSHAADVGDDLVKLDAAGTLEWQRAVGERIENAVVLGDGRFVVADRAVDPITAAASESLVGLDADGAETWRMPVSLASGERTLVAAMASVTPDRVAIALSNSSVRSALAIFDGNGARIAEAAFDPHGAVLFQPISVSPAAAGGWIVTGADGVRDPMNPAVYTSVPVILVTSPSGVEVARQRLTLPISYPQVCCGVEAANGEIAAIGWGDQLGTVPFLFETLGLGSSPG